MANITLGYGIFFPLGKQGSFLCGHHVRELLSLFIWYVVYFILCCIQFDPILPSFRQGLLSS